MLSSETLQVLGALLAVAGPTLLGSLHISGNTSRRLGGGMTAIGLATILGISLFGRRDRVTSLVARVWGDTSKKSLAARTMDETAGPFQDGERIRFCRPPEPRLNGSEPRAEVIAEVLIGSDMSQTIMYGPEDPLRSGPKIDRKIHPDKQVTGVLLHQRDESYFVELLCEG